MRTDEIKVSVTRNLPGGAAPTFEGMSKEDLDEFVKRIERGFRRAFSESVEEAAKRLTDFGLHSAERSIGREELR